MRRPGALLALPVLLSIVVACSSDTSPEHDHVPGMDMAGMDMAGMEPQDEAAVAAGRELAERLAGADPGETVVVEPGTYRGNFVVRRPVRLIGDGMAVLDGGGQGRVLTIAPGAAGTTVRGLHIMGSGPGPVGTPSGIRVEADGVTVEDVTVMDTYMGIQVMGARDAHVVGNQITGFADGSVTGELHATEGEADMTGMDHAGGASGGGARRGDAITLSNATDAVVEGNEVTDARDGVFMSFARRADVRDNDVRDSRYAIHAMYASDLTTEHNYFDGNLAGAILMYGGPFDFTGNTIVHSRSPATGVGVLLKDGAGATLTRNVIVANRVGIKLDNGGATSSEAEPATMRSNTIGLNQIGIEIMQASRGTFSRNSFIENAVQVVTDGETPNIEWTVADVGNYWSSYKGYDTGDDGVGDLPFVQGGSIERTLARSPSLAALVSGPAFRLLQAVEDRWAPENPVVLDARPLTRIDSPAMEGARRPKPAGLALGLVGGVVAGLAALVLVRSRLPRVRVGHV